MKKLSTLALQQAKIIFSNRLFVLAVGSILLTAFFLVPQISQAQSTIYTTNFGTDAGTATNPLGTTASPALATNWTFTGITMNITNGSNASAGYTGASAGSYLGEENSNPYVNTSGTSEGSDVTTTGAATSTATLKISTTNFSSIVISYGIRRSSSTYSGTVTLAWSTDNVTYTPITYTEPTAGNWGLVTGAGLSLPSGASNASTFYLRWSFAKPSGAQKGNYKIDDLTITGTPPNPTLSSNNSILSGFAYPPGSGPSASQGVEITGGNLSPAAGNITIAGSTDYLVSSDNINFSSSASLAYTGSGLSASSPNFWVELKSGLSSGNYNGEIIAVSGGGATTINITANGSVGSYYWNGASPQTVGTTSVTANGGTGSWGTVGSWVEPATPGTAATWADGNAAVFAGTAGAVTLDANRSAFSVEYSTTGYTLQTTAIAATPKTPTSILTSPITLDNNVALTLAPYVNITTPNNGNMGIGSVSGAGTANIIISAAQSSTAVSNLVSLATTNCSINVPVTISSAGGSGSAGYAGFTAQATGTQINGNITNNASISTIIGAQNGFDITVNGIVSGSAGLTFGQSNTGGGKGTIVLANNNNYSGGTFLDVTAANGAPGGLVALGINNALPTTGNLTIGDISGDGGTLDLNGFSQTIGSLISKVATSPLAIITNNGATNSVLTITQSSDQSFLPSIIDGAGGATLAVVKNGANLLNFTGTGTGYAFSGGLTINQGELRFNPSGAVTMASNVTLGGGKLGTTGITASTLLTFSTLALTDNSTISLDATNAHKISFAASNGVSWTSGKKITITGWQGTYLGGNSGTKGQIFIGGGTTALTAGQLAQVQFEDASNNLYSATLLSTGELVPLVNINPAIITSPTSLAFAGQTVGTNSTSQSFNLSGGNLTGFPGNLTVTAPSTDFQVSNNNSTWGSSTTIAYSTATLSATPVYVRFTPQTTGSKSGNITITGGGVAISGSVAVSGGGSATYTSAQSGNWSSTSTWQGGIVPQGGADVIIIQNGHNVTLDANDTSISSLTINAGGTLTLNNNTNELQVQSAGGGTTTVNGTLVLGSSLISIAPKLFTSTTLTVGNGGVFTNSTGNAATVSVTNFNVNNGGTYNHDAVGSSSAGASTDFPGTASGINLGNTSTVVITKWGQTGGSPNALPAIVYGNLTLNIGTTLTGSWGQSGGISTINGTLNVMQTGGTGTAVFRFVKSQSLPKITIGGDLIISGGSIGINNNTTYPNVNIGGNVSISGGTLDIDGGSGTGADTVNIGGNFLVSGTGIIERTGNSTSLAVVNFNKSSGIQTFSSAATGINSNKITWNVGDGISTNTLQLNSSFIMSSASILNVLPNNSIICGTDVVIDSSLALLGSSALNLNGHTLTLNLNSPLSASRASGSFTGSSTSGLTIGGTATGGGTFNFTSGSQILQNLTLDGSSDDTLGTNLSIASTGNLTVVNGLLNTEGNLTLKSDANGTAYVSPNTSGSTYITGNVTVERYIPANSERAWRLLSIPTQTVQTINQSWQEGQTGGVIGTPGLGTIITTSKTSRLVDGFDYQQMEGSMLTYNQGTGAWSEVSTTNGNTPSDTAANPTGGLIATKSGYFIYIRGDRTEAPASTTGPTTATVLRTNGPLYEGTQSPVTVPATGAANGYGLIGNIYASAIDFTQISGRGTGIDNLFYVWDPKVLNNPPSLGAYVVFSPVTTPAWEPIPGGGSYTSGVANTQIQSGQAFFVHASSSTNNTITLAESNKVSGSALVFRPESPSNASAQLATNLYEVSTGSQSLADGNVAVFNSAYSDSVDGNDALKLSNTQENFGILVGGKSLIIEAGQPITATDTLSYTMWNMKQQQYNLEFTPTNLNTAGMAAYLLDNYLNTRTALSLNSVTDVPFIVDGATRSSASNRFEVVFNNFSTPVPVTFININAQQQNNASVLVSWEVGVQNGISGYEVEHSTDGKTFTGIGEITAKGTGNVSYSFTDAGAVNGENDYRIESIGIAGGITYSNVASVMVGGSSITGIKVYPNPVTGGQLNIKFMNLVAGSYAARLLNIGGQEVYGTVLNYANGDTKSVNIPSTLATGVYKLEVTAPDNKVYETNIIIQ